MAIVCLIKVYAVNVKIRLPASMLNLGKKRTCRQSFVSKSGVFTEVVEKQVFAEEAN
jgi:hypothetical protein